MPGEKWVDPPHYKIAGDCDWDPIVEETWREIQKKGFVPGIRMTDEEWKEVDELIEEIEKRRS